MKYMTRSVATRTVVLVMICSALLFSKSKAQEIKYIDLTNETQRTTLRSLSSLPPKCANDGNCVSSAMFGGSVSDCGVDARDPHALKTSVTWTNEIEYTDGDSATWEMKVENVGTVPFDVPVSPHLADLQPEDPAAPFHFSETGLSPVLYAKNASARFGYILLYGSKDKPETILHLNPGEWIRVRAQTLVTLMKADTPASALEGRLRAGFWIHLVTYTSRPEGSFSNAINVCFRNDDRDGSVVRLHPKK